MSRNTPSAGDLRDRVELQSFTDARDTHGEKDIWDERNWTTDATLWANVEPQSGAENTEGDQVAGEVTHKVTIRHRKGVTRQHRLLYRVAHTTLNGALSTTDGTSVTVSDAFDVPERNRFYIKVESELMEVSTGHGTVNLTVARGANNTTAATHADSTDVHFLGELGIESVIDPDNRREALVLNCKETR